ncbi:hypothetical protein ABZ345_21000 [Lentzea sp. NPDC005914]|uniref:hypothetical protein n=1 Tax=Lentzea sp. NPDC005914 TaxID=3154572 RepID=UPI00340B30B9
MKLWSPLLLLALTACAPTVVVAEEPRKPTFADVDVCTLMKDGDVEWQKLTSATATGERGCRFAYGKDKGSLTVEVTLSPQPFQTAARAYCVIGDGCAIGTRFTDFKGLSIMHTCADTSGSVRCEGFVEIGDEKTLTLVVKRSPDSSEALGQVTVEIARRLLNEPPVTS